jgi:hypothetical protein
MWVQHEQGLVLVRPGWVELGQRHSQMKKSNAETGEVGVCPPRHAAVSGLHGADKAALRVSRKRS